MGRPSDYTPELAATICERLAGGETLRAICRDPGMPDERTVRGWAIDDRDGFSPHYARARELGYHAMADETLEIADDTSHDFRTVETDDGTREIVDHEHIQRSRLRVDTRKWLLAKALPKIYGEKVAFTGENGGPVRVLNLHDLSDTELTAIAATGRGRTAPAPKGKARPAGLRQRHRGARKANQRRS